MTSKEWLEKAKAEKFAIGAFNVGNLETLKAVVQAAVNKRSPVIIESSPGETEWMGAGNIVALSQHSSEEYRVDILVNLDHAGSWEECQKGLQAGYDLIHFDGSKLSWEDNVRIAKQVVEEAHSRGLVVEGEVDHIQGSSEVHMGSAQTEIANMDFSDPVRAKQFVDATGIDIYAAFFGNVHGVFSQGDESLRLDVLEKLANTLPQIFFSLHGGSGIPDDQVKAAIERGIVKVNINTEVRQVYRANLEKALADNPSEYAMYKLMPSVVAEVQKLIEHKIDIFGSAGKLNE